MARPVDNKEVVATHQIKKADSTEKFSEVMKFSLYEKALKVENKVGSYFAVIGYVLAAIVTLALFFAIDYAVARNNFLNSTPSISSASSLPEPALNPTGSSATSSGGIIDSAKPDGNTCDSLRQGAPLETIEEDGEEVASLYSSSVSVTSTEESLTASNEGGRTLSNFTVLIAAADDLAAPPVPARCTAYGSRNRAPALPVTTEKTTETQETDVITTFEKLANSYNDFLGAYTSNKSSVDRGIEDTFLKARTSAYEAVNKNRKLFCHNKNPSGRLAQALIEFNDNPSTRSKNSVETAIVNFNLFQRSSGGAK